MYFLRKGSGNSVVSRNKNPSKNSFGDIVCLEMVPQLPSPINVRSAAGPMFLGLMSNAKKIQLEKPVEVIRPIFGAEVTKHVCLLFIPFLFILAILVCVCVGVLVCVGVAVSVYLPLCLRVCA